VGDVYSSAQLTKAIKITPGATAPQFDWHAGSIIWTTPVTSTYRNTQNVQQFLQSQKSTENGSPKYQHVIRHSRERGNTDPPRTQRLPWTPAFAGVTG
jgi:hypothetical protein